MYRLVPLQQPLVISNQLAAIYKQDIAIVGGKNGSFQNLSVTGVKDVTVPESRGIYLGLDSDAAGGIDICADTNQYIDFTTMLNNYRGRLIYNATNNDLKCI